MNVSVVIEEYFGKRQEELGSVVVVDKPQLSASHHSLLTQTSWSGCHRSVFVYTLSHRCSPPSLEHLLGDESWNLWQLAHLGEAATSNWFGCKWAICWTHWYTIIITSQLAGQSYWSVCLAVCRWCGWVPHRSWAFHNYCLFLTSVRLSLLFRDFLTTAHTQVCTVIRFSQSRFVPASRLLVMLDLLLSLSETLWLAGLDTANVCSYPLFFPCLQTLLGIAFPPLHSRSETALYPFSLFTLFCHFSVSLLLHLRWSSPDTTMAFSLESSPTPFRDAF